MIEWIISATKTYRAIQEIDLYPMDLENDVLQIAVSEGQNSPSAN